MAARIAIKDDDTSTFRDELELDTVMVDLVRNIETVATKIY